MYYFQNRVEFNTDRRISYTYEPTGANLFAGVKLLTVHEFTHYAMANVDTIQDQVDITDGFSNLEKYIALTNNRHEAGGENGNDVMDIISSGPHLIEPGDSIRVAFALMAGENQYTINLIADNAQAVYDSVFLSESENTSIALQKFSLYPNPVDDRVFVRLFSKITGDSRVIIYNMQGNKCFDKLYEGRNLIINLGEMPNGMYIIRIKNSFFDEGMKLLVR